MLLTTAWRKAKRCHGDRAVKKISLYCYQGNNCGKGGDGERNEAREKDSKKIRSKKGKNCFEKGELEITGGEGEDEEEKLGSLR